MYLGFPFYRSLSMKSSGSARALKCNKLASSMYPFLRNPTIPLSAKMTVLRGVAMPIFTFGGEMLGMNVSLAQSIQSIANKCFKSLCKGWGNPAGAPLTIDLGIDSVFETTSVMRARAFASFAGSHSFVSNLISLKARPSRSSSWTSGAERWFRRQRIPAGDLAKVRSCCSFRSLCSDRSQGAKDYYAQQFFETGPLLVYTYVRLPEASLHLDVGMAGLITIRAGGLWTGYRAARAGLISDFYLDHCPCCGGACRESLSHMLIFCPAWNDARMRFIFPLYALLPSRLSNTSSLVTVLLGGAAEGVCFGPTWITAQRFLPIVRFLASIKRSRSMFIWGGVGTRSQGAITAQGMPQAGVVS